MRNSKIDLIDGVGSSRSFGWGDSYPLDSVFVRTEQRTVGEVVKRINAGRYQLDPDFQRDFLWSSKLQSRLIESCLMRIPLPVFYLAEKKDGSVAVVDGLQRLSTFTRFMGDELELVFEPIDGEYHPLHGRCFSDLNIAQQERIEDTQLVLYILDVDAPERAKLDIFERVNNGVPLSRQQMRNCIYSGIATRWLRQAAECEEFLSASGASLDKKKMRDREVVNRFCAFYLLGSQAYTNADMDGYLARALDLMNNLDEYTLDLMLMDFKHSMLLNEIIFGEHAFRKSIAGPGVGYPSKSVFNVALFDVCAISFAKLSHFDALSRCDEIRALFENLLLDWDFINSISTSTNSVRQVHNRFHIVNNALRAIGL